MKFSDEDVDCAWSDLHPGRRIRWSTPTFVRRGTILRIKNRALAVMFDGMPRETIIPDARWYYAQGKLGNINEHLVAINSPAPKKLKLKKLGKEKLGKTFGVAAGDALIGPTEAANILGIDQKALRRRLRNGQLKGEQTEGGRWVLRRSDILGARR